MNAGARNGVTLCRNEQCQRPATLFLCEDCTEQLANMLGEMPWLIDELDNRIRKLDRIGVGTVGRNRRPDELNVMDFDAAEAARRIRQHLIVWVTKIAERALGRTPPALDTAHTGALAEWLKHNVGHIARDPRAGEVYQYVDGLVGTTQEGGALVAAINRTDRTYYGPCNAPAGKNRDGTARPCGADLYAPRESRDVTCNKCGATADAKRQLIATITARDLVTESKLLEALDELDEHVSTKRLNAWIAAGRLVPRGWVHEGRIVGFKIRHKDPRVFSLSQARQLRISDLQHAGERTNP